MRVVSQSRNYSVDFDRTVFLVQNLGIYAKIDDNNVLFGIYGNEKRAKEVFEDIHRAYAPIYSISNNLTEEEVAAMLMPSKNILAKNIINAGMDMYLTTYDNYVYYMPEK